MRRTDGAREAEREAFSRLSPTCPKVDAAVDEVSSWLREELDAMEEEFTARLGSVRDDLGSALSRMTDIVKDQTTSLREQLVTAIAERQALEDRVHELTDDLSRERSAADDLRDELRGARREINDLEQQLQAAAVEA